MITETKVIYKCEHCRKLYQKAYAAQQHEITCVKNPDNKRACFGCSNLCKKETTYYFDTFAGEASMKIELLYCNAKNIFLYPPKVEHKKNYYDLGDESNDPMPKQCELRKEDWPDTPGIPFFL